MSDDQKRIELIRLVLGKDCEPPTIYPACWHNPRSHDESGVDPAAKQLAPVKQGKSLFRRVLAQLVYSDK